MSPFPISKQLKTLFNAIIDQGDELRLVGGCVRDFLSGKRISDIDLACKYKPEEVMKILQKKNIKTIPTGIRHGTVTAIIDNSSFEITTLRKDIETYGRAAKVKFTDDFYLDAKRRDFTINAIYMDIDGKIYDYFDGQKDLKNKIVKFIGDPYERIKEDYLRILRFFRFSCYYAEEIDQYALKVVIDLKNHINDLSADRIRNELIKLISCEKKYQILETIILMKNNQILDLAINHKIDLKYIRNLFEIENKMGDLGHLIRFSALIYNASNQAKKICKNLNFSNKDTKYIDFVINPKIKINLEISKYDLIKLLFDYDKNLIIDILLMSLIEKDIDEVIINKFLFLKKDILNIKIPKFFINGNDLLEIGIQPKDIGGILILARNYWIENDFKPSRDKIFLKLKTLEFLTG